MEVETLMDSIKRHLNSQPPRFRRAINAFDAVLRLDLTPAPGPRRREGEEVEHKKPTEITERAFSVIRTFLAGCKPRARWEFQFMLFNAQTSSKVYFFNYPTSIETNGFPRSLFFSDAQQAIIGNLSDEPSKTIMHGDLRLFGVQERIKILTIEFYKAIVAHNEHVVFITKAYPPTVMGIGKGVKFLVTCDDEERVCTKPTDVLLPYEENEDPEFVALHENGTIVYTNKNTWYIGAEPRPFAFDSIEKTNIETLRKKKEEENGTEWNFDEYKIKQHSDFARVWFIKKPEPSRKETVSKCPVKSQFTQERQNVRIEFNGTSISIYIKLTEKMDRNKWGIHGIKDKHFRNIVFLVDGRKVKDMPVCFTTDGKCWSFDTNSHIYRGYATFAKLKSPPSRPRRGTDVWKELSGYELLVVLESIGGKESYSSFVTSPDGRFQIYQTEKSKMEKTTELIPAPLENRWIRIIKDYTRQRDDDETVGEQIAKVRKHIQKTVKQYASEEGELYNRDEMLALILVAKLCQPTTFRMFLAINQEIIFYQELEFFIKKVIYDNQSAYFDHIIKEISAKIMITHKTEEELKKYWYELTKKKYTGDMKFLESKLVEVKILQTAMDEITAQLVQVERHRNNARIGYVIQSLLDVAMGEFEPKKHVKDIPRRYRYELTENDRPSDYIAIMSGHNTTPDFYINRHLLRFMNEKICNLARRETINLDWIYEIEIKNKRGETTHFGADQLEARNGEKLKVQQMKNLVLNDGASDYSQKVDPEGDVGTALRHYLTKSYFDVLKIPQKSLKLVKEVLYYFDINVEDEHIVNGSTHCRLMDFATDKSISEMLVPEWTRRTDVYFCKYTQNGVTVGTECIRVNRKLLEFSSGLVRDRIADATRRRTNVLRLPYELEYQEKALLGLVNINHLWYWSTYQKVRVLQVYWSLRCNEAYFNLLHSIVATIKPIETSFIDTIVNRPCWGDLKKLLKKYRPEVLLAWNAAYTEPITEVSRLMFKQIDYTDHVADLSMFDDQWIEENL